MTVGETRRLEDVADLQVGFAFKSSEFGSSGTRLLRGLNVSQRRIEWLQEARLERATAPERYNLQENDLVVAMDRPWVEAGLKRAVVRRQDVPSLLVQRVCRVRARPGILQHYLHQVVCGPAFASYVRRIADGSTIPHISQSQIGGFETHVPGVDDQRRVAAVLCAYDDLIDNNRRRVRALEASVHLAFASHFTLGRGDTAYFKELVDINPTLRIPVGAISYLPMEALSTTDMIVGSFRTRTRATGVRFERGDTLMARITPSLQNGKTGFVATLADGEVACGSTEFIVLRGRTVSPEYTYCLARSAPVRSAAISSMSGATGRQRVSAGCFDDLVVAAPQPEQLASFTAVVRPMFETIRLLAQATGALSEQRDLLLPKLISGEVEVSELDIDTSRIEEQEARWREAAVSR